MRHLQARLCNLFGTYVNTRNNYIFCSIFNITLLLLPVFFVTSLAQGGCLAAVSADVSVATPSVKVKLVEVKLSVEIDREERIVYVRYASGERQPMLRYAPALKVMRAILSPNESRLAIHLRQTSGSPNDQLALINVDGTNMQTFGSAGTSFANLRWVGGRTLRATFRMSSSSSRGRFASFDVQRGVHVIKLNASNRITGVSAYGRQPSRSSSTEEREERQPPDNNRRRSQASSGVDQSEGLSVMIERETRTVSVKAPGKSARAIISHSRSSRVLRATLSSDESRVAIHLVRANSRRDGNELVIIGSDGTRMQSFSGDDVYFGNLIWVNDRMLRVYFRFHSFSSRGEFASFPVQNEGSHDITVDQVNTVTGVSPSQVRLGTGQRADLDRAERADVDRQERKIYARFPDGSRTHLLEYQRSIDVERAVLSPDRSRAAIHFRQSNSRNARNQLAIINVDDSNMQIFRGEDVYFKNLVWVDNNTVRVYFEFQSFRSRGTFASFPIQNEGSHDISIDPLNTVFGVSPL